MADLRTTPDDAVAPAVPVPAVAVDVCICTYLRPSVVETIRSVAAQLPPPARIVVVDNAPAPEAAERVRASQAGCAVPVVYRHAPARNISIARNAALQAAVEDWIAFLDDDETAAPGWLAALLAEAERGGWDAVLGPVDADYPAGAPAWIRALDAHSTRPVTSGGEIRKGYAGNVLLRRAVVERLKLQFDPALGRTGGEDDSFFYGLTDGGGRIGFAPDALAREPVPEARMRLPWLLRRSFRMGQSHGARLVAEHGVLARAGSLAVAAGKAAICAVAALAGLASRPRRNRWLLRGALHAGAVARLVGHRELQIY
jgi:succinoglycan biosynthesis protein ExoM